jgi:hypothetical protein
LSIDQIAHSEAADSRLKRAGCSSHPLADLA